MLRNIIILINLTQAHLPLGLSVFSSLSDVHGSKESAMLLCFLMQGKAGLTKYSSQSLS